MGKMANRARRYLRIHLGVYAAAATLSIVLDVVAADALRFLWGVLVWGFLVFLHYMYVKTVTIDNGWARRRARDVTEKAYDAGHIEDIRKRYRDRSSA